MNFERKTRRPTLVAVAFLLTAIQAGASVENNWEAGLEVLRASDITLLQGSAVGKSTLAGWETSLSAATGHTAIDYAPVSFDFQGIARKREETSGALQINARRQVDERWTMLAGGGGTYGYTNYRSVWLDEFFRQEFAGLTDLPGFESYRKANPRSLNATAGLRWAYRPGSAFAQLAVTQISEHISPGYEVDFDGLTRFRDTLATTALNLNLENIVSPRVRSLIDLRATKTSEREWRLGAEAALNIALSESWTSRLRAGLTHEAPEFDARYFEASLEYAVTPSLAFIVSGQYYRDTGEIENALLFTSASPELHSRQWRTALRWTGEHWSAHVLIGAVYSKYGATNPDTDFFQILYRDRNWTMAQLSIGRRF